MLGGFEVAPPCCGVNFRLGNLRAGLTDMLLLHSADGLQRIHQPAVCCGYFLQSRDGTWDLMHHR